MKRGLVVIAFLLLLAPLIAAETTEIKIKTTPFGNVNVNILSLGSLDVIEHINLDADNYGDATFTFSTSESYFDMTVYVKKADAKFHYEKFTGQDVGGTLSYEVAPEDFEFFYAPDEEPETESNDTETNDTVVNDTVVNDTEIEVIQEVEDQGPGITGLATSDDTGFFSGNTIFYVVGIVVVLAILLVGSMSMRKKVGSEKKEIKVKKLSELKEEKAEKISDYRKAIEEAEKKIEEAQKDIKKIKNEDKISEMKKRIAKEQEELEKLEKGDD